MKNHSEWAFHPWTTPPPASKHKWIGRNRFSQLPTTAFTSKMALYVPQNVVLGACIPKRRFSMPNYWEAYMCDWGRSIDLDELWHVHCRNVQILALQVMTLKRQGGKGINGYRNTNYKGQRWDGCNPASAAIMKHSNIPKTCAISVFQMS